MAGSLVAGSLVAGNLVVGECSCVVSAVLFEALEYSFSTYTRRSPGSFLAPSLREANEFRSDVCAELDLNPLI